MFSEFDVFFDDANKCYQVRTKATCFVLDFDDDEKKTIFERMLDVPKDGLSSSYQALIKEFDQSKVLDVLVNLKDYGLLPLKELSTVPELVSDNGGESAAPYEMKELDTLKVLIISDGKIGEVLKSTLIDREVKETQLISTEFFTSLTSDQINDTLSKNDFCFMDGSRWNPKAIELLNTHAIKQKKPWLHIGGFEEHLLKLGPLFLGTETGCYNCFIKRIKSNHEYIEYFGPYQHYLTKNGKSSQPDKFIHEDAFYGLLANIAFLELTKFHQMWSVPSTWKRLITINALDFESTGHDLLKVPFCEVCNEMQAYNPSPWLEPISI